MNLKEIMSRDLVIGNIDATVTEISELMKKYDIGFVPIEQKNHIIGVVTDRDIACRKSSIESDGEENIETFMTHNIVHVDINDSLETAANKMGEEKVKRLIITDQEKIVGIVSMSDLIHSDIDPEYILKNLKKLWEINRNTETFSTEIDEFYL